MIRLSLVCNGKNKMSKSVLILAAVLGSGLIAGVFFAFSTIVMAALDRLTPAQSIAAMQSINITVINPLFMFVLFGTAALAGYLGYVSYFSWGSAESKWLLFGSLAYIAAIVITLTLNVPMNEALAVLDPSAREAQQYWREFINKWSFFNHLRGVFSTMACGFFAMALLNLI